MKKQTLIIVFVLVITAIIFIASQQRNVEGFKKKSSKKPAKPVETSVAETPAAKPVETTATKPVETTATKPVETTATKPVEPTATKPVEPTATKPVEPTATKPVEPSTTEPAEKPPTPTVNRDFINNALYQQNELNNQLQTLQNSLSQLKTELAEATTAALNSKNALEQINREKTSAIKEINEKQNEVLKTADAVDTNLKQTEQINTNVKQAEKNIIAATAKFNIAADNAKTTDNFMTLEQAYGSPISNLWKVEEGFSNANDGQPWAPEPDIFKLTDNLSTALKTFHQAYYDYAGCYYKNKTTPPKCTNADLTTKKTAFETATAALNSAIVAATNAIQSVKTNPSRVDEATAIERHNKLKELAQQVETTRTDIDVKIKTLFDKNDKPNDVTKNLTNAQYVTIGWSILAASTLYYIFTELTE